MKKKQTKRKSIPIRYHIKTDRNALFILFHFKILQRLFYRLLFLRRALRSFSVTLTCPVKVLMLYDAMLSLNPSNIEIPCLQSLFWF